MFGGTMQSFIWKFLEIHDSTDIANKTAHTKKYR